MNGATSGEAAGDRAGEALRASERRLELAAKAAGLGIWDWDVATGAMIYSARAKAICGFAPDQEVTFDLVRSITHPDDYPVTSALARRALDPELRDHPVFEYRLVRPDGEVRWVLAYGEAVFEPGPDGRERAVRYVGTIQDITDRKHAADALAESEQRLRLAEAGRERTERQLADTVERLRLATEGTGLGTYDLDLVNDVGIWSSQTFEMLGLPVPPDCKANAAAWRDLLHPDDAPRVAAEHERAAAAGGSWRVEYRIRRADTGEQRWMSVYGQFLHEGGRAVRSVGIVVDVTDQKQAEEDAAAVRYRLERVGQATPSLIHIYDRDARKSVWINGRVAELVGYTPEEVLARPSGSLAELVHPDDLGIIHARYEALEPKPDGHVVESEYRIVRRDGEWRWLLDRTVAFVRGPGGRVVQTLTAAIDITERKRAEQRQALLMHELNHRVKNTLAIVQAIAAQTFRGDGVEPRRRRDFEERLGALSAVHNLLTRENWEAAELGDILREALSPYDAAETRFTIEGPRVMLAPKTAVALSLAFHELCTNAAKYGALSREGGVVKVAWSLDGAPGEERLALDWREEGGPRVSPPAARGFGSRMIERGLSSELDGSVVLEFPPEGLRCRVEARLPAAAIG